jgi:hypothetical protein
MNAIIVASGALIILSIMAIFVKFKKNKISINQKKC